ncbi:family 20 glycosylhydrolase [Phenylobacterium sp.]|uniref:family 20 glycosylhydrolase n=1 Tax=Phenylobacterium sp. TaxID=1871053 RepID=UPI002897BF65|nr:family 20 glycosylhydrolase [Phenylobacterium sp.]
MIRSLLLATAAAALLATSSWAGAPIVPAPVSDIPRDGGFQLDARTVISAPADDPQAMASARHLAELLGRSRGLMLAVRAPRAGERAIVLSRQGPAGEAYRLEVSGQRIAIASAGDAGLFYGAVTAWQLATVDGRRGPILVAARQIEDAPRFAWRGVMLDSARHFQSVDYVKGLIDRMALAKLNTLHWHLTDDQGWRLEIKKYPRLTEVGAWRAPAGPAAAADIDPKTGKPRVIGGYYTQDQVRDVVAYAAARHVTIVPEIETPGHAHAPIVAYPDLGSAATPPAATSSDWGVFPYLYNVDEKTFAFLDDVLSEVVALFPGRYVHVGGDEAVKDQWKTNPAVQARMKELHIASERQLQGWFISRVEQMLEAKGRRLIGWDEILEGGVAESATVMSWRGIDGAIIAAKLGHDTILSPEPMMYLNYRQSAAPGEPPGRGAVVSLKDVYSYEPMPAALNADERHHVLGVQGNIWTEHARTEERVSLMLFPRVAALAETAWSPAAAKDWDGFADRLPVELDRYRGLGLAFDETPLKVRALSSPSGTGARVALLGAEDVGEIRYTLDGSQPAAGSALYTAPLEVPLGTRVRAQAFRGGQALAAPSDIAVDARSIRTRASQELASCQRQLVLNLEDDAPIDGERARFLVDILSPCWLYEGVDLTGVSQIEAAVGQIPFNFQIGQDIEKIRFRPPATAEGELEVRQGSCSGAVVATLPLAPAARSQGVTVLSGQIAGAPGPQDLCFTFTQKTVEPMWVLDRVTLVAGAGHER